MDLLQVVEAIALGVVGFAAQDRRDEGRDQRRIHLPVAVELDDDGRTICHGATITGHHGAADAEVLRVPEHAHARIVAGSLDLVAAAFRAGIVDAVDAVDLRADRGQQRQDVAGHPVAGYHHGNDGFGSHRRSVPEHDSWIGGLPAAVNCSNLPVRI